MLCLDCIGEIISFLNDQKTFFKLYSLSKRVKFYIENENPMCAKNVLFLMYKFPKKYLKFVITCKVKFKLRDKHLQYFIGVHSLYIFNHYSEHITDEGLKYLKGIKNLILSNNQNITDKGLKYLKGIKSLNLLYNKHITDEGLKYLKGIKNLILSNNQNITDKGLKHLIGIESLNLSRNENITDEGLKYLRGIRKLILLKNQKVGLKYLSGIQDLIFCHNNKNIMN
jgi:Leucine-rich repeat (LRR) protein